jgi:hypothetical protein
MSQKKETLLILEVQHVRKYREDTEDELQDSALREEKWSIAT